MGTKLFRGSCRTRWKKTNCGPFDCLRDDTGALCALLLLERAFGPGQEACVGSQGGGRVICFLHTHDFAVDHAHMVARGRPTTGSDRGKHDLAIFVRRRHSSSGLQLTNTILAGQGPATSGASLGMPYRLRCPNQAPKRKRVAIGRTALSMMTRPKM